MRRTLLLESIAGLGTQYQNRVQANKELHQLARQFDAAGDEEAAKRAYRDLLQTDYENAEAWLEIGLIRHRTGQTASALDAIVHALQLQPQSGRIHYAFGSLLCGASSPEVAVRSYQNAIGAVPTDGDLQSLHVCREEVAASPDHTVHLILGNVLMAQHNLDEAIAFYTQSFRGCASAEAARNLAFAHEISHDGFRSSLYTGYAHHLEGRPEEALRCLEGLSPKPYDDLYFCKVLVMCYVHFREYEKAIHVYRQASCHHSDADQLAVEIAAKLDAKGHAAQVIALTGEALRIWPGNVGLRYLHHLTLPAVCESEGEMESCRRRFSKGLKAISDAPFQTVEERTQALDAIGRVSPYYLAYQNKNDVQLQMQYGALVHGVMRSHFPELTTPPTVLAADNRRIRVGYISAFLQHHSVGTMHLGWLRYRDRSRFETFCYHLGKEQDYITSQYRLETDHFRDLPAGLECICKQVLADRLDILVFLDIGMFPLATQLAALRLAPVQCCSWGHPETTGLPTIDYFISGAAMEPPDADKHYSETLVQLPGFGLAYEPVDVPSQPKTREEFGIPSEAVVYVSCQSLYKYLPRYDSLFPAIVRSVPKAKLVFAAGEGMDAWRVGRFRERIRRAFEKVQLDYRSHCILLPRQGWLDYLSLYVRSEVYLDSLGFSGGITSLDAIACALPPVTMPGEFMRGRMTSAFLRLMGVTETIAETEEDYVSIAVKLGLDAEFRQTIREKIIDRRHELFNNPACVRGLEDFYSRAFSSIQAANNL